MAFWLQLNASSVSKMNCREKITESIMNASEVQFNWSLASSRMDYESREVILEQIVRKWITIRQLDLQSLFLKRESKKSTEKAKPLRSTLVTAGHKPIIIIIIGSYY